MDLPQPPSPWPLSVIDTTTSPPPPPSEISALKALCAGIKSLFGCSDYSNLIIECQGRVFHVHRSILCTQCEFFKKACAGGFKEATENRISMNDDNPDQLNAMLQNLYISNYDCFDNTEKSCQLHLHVCMVKLADKYDLVVVKKLATQKFEAIAKGLNVKDKWDKLSMRSFAGVIATIYGPDFPSDTDLRRATLRGAHHLVDMLISDKEARDATKDVPDFWMEMAQFRQRGPERMGGWLLIKYKCDGRCSTSHGNERRREFTEWVRDDRVFRWCPSCREGISLCGFKESDDDDWHPLKELDDERMQMITHGFVSSPGDHHSWLFHEPRPEYTV